MFSNQPVPGLAQCGYYDLDVEILFYSQGRTNAAPSAGKGNGVPFHRATGLRGHIAEDGRWAAIDEGSDQWPDRAVCIRRVLPFLAALQGKVTLHASAVATPAGVYAFVGASGAGKSTLSSCLEKFDLRAVADDLLPCRMQGDFVAVPLGQDDTLPLRGLYFLSRQDSLESARRTPLNSADCLKRLLVHGFGEISIKTAWATQFAAYTSIARTVPSYDLVVPDALPRLNASVAAVREMIAEQAFQAVSHPAET
ncbi:hypothetical protein [Mesorhizobium delmotii]|uniref:hypothetical protein n=1 Tax=Mesorhizobium delmotii TaxID=1631247 RepID=UPI0010580A18|nr:hypothetical protein [Mesorhizobium delmotii]